MRTDQRDTDPTFKHPPTPKPAPAKGGCFSSILLLFGGATIVIPLIGYILGLFGMVLEISGSKLPFIDLPIFLILAGIGLFFMGLGWLVGKLEDKIKAKKNKQA